MRTISDAGTRVAACAEVQRIVSSRCRASLHELNVPTAINKQFTDVPTTPLGVFGNVDRASKKQTPTSSKQQEGSAEWMRSRRCGRGSSAPIGAPTRCRTMHP